MMGHAVHIVVVEIDVETGQVSFLSYLAVHDVGTVVNPRSLKGQIRGGIAKGIGVTLMEQIRHDAEGHALTGSFEEYLMPLAGDVPNVEVLHHETKSPFTARGVKGGGEGGRMGGPVRDHDGDRGRAVTVRRADRRAADHRRADRRLGGAMRLDHAALMISDPERARAFYVGVLGLPEVSRPPTFTFPGLWVAVGDRQLHLIGEAEPGRAGETIGDYRPEELATGYTSHFAIHVDDLEAFLAGVRSRGGNVVAGPRPRGRRHPPGLRHRSGRQRRRADADRRRRDGRRAGDRRAD